MQELEASLMLVTFFFFFKILEFLKFIKNSYYIFLLFLVHFAIALHHYGRLRCIYSIEGKSKTAYMDPGYLVIGEKGLPYLSFGRLIWDYIERYYERNVTVFSRTLCNFMLYLNILLIHSYPRSYSNI